LQYSFRSIGRFLGSRVVFEHIFITSTVSHRIGFREYLGYKYMVEQLEFIQSTTVLHHKIYSFKVGEKISSYNVCFTKF